MAQLATSVRLVRSRILASHRASSAWASARVATSLSATRRTTSVARASTRSATSRDTRATPSLASTVVVMARGSWLCISSRTARRTSSASRTRTASPSVASRVRSCSPACAAACRTLREPNCTSEQRFDESGRACARTVLRQRQQRREPAAGRRARSRPSLSQAVPLPLCRPGRALLTRAHSQGVHQARAAVGR